MLGRCLSGTLPGAPFNIIYNRVVLSPSAAETDCANQEPFLRALARHSRLGESSRCSSSNEEQ